MISEWMKVMLGEISRKQAEAEQVRAEERRRRHEHGRRAETGRRHAQGISPRPGDERAAG